MKLCKPVREQDGPEDMGVQQVDNCHKEGHTERLGVTKLETAYWGAGGEAWGQGRMLKSSKT